MSKDVRFYQWKCGKEWTKQIDIEKLYAFWFNYYNPLKRKEKEALTSYMRYNNIENIDFIPDIVEITKWYQRDLMSQRAKQGNLNYKNRTTQLERDITQKNRVLKTEIGRIKNALNVNSTLTYEEARYQSYINGLETKGRNNAKMLGLNIDNMSTIDIIKLSGIQKKQSHANLSEHEKYNYKIAWKKSNLKHTNIRNILISENPEFENINIEIASPEIIEKWYSTYLSITSSTRIANGINHYSYCKSGHYFSKKCNRRFYYRSSYELLVCQYLDELPLVQLYSMESFCIKYTRAGENFERRYRPDFIVNINNTTLILEVKPEKHVNTFIEQKGQFISTPITIVTENHIKTKEIFYEYIKNNIKYDR